MAGSVFGAAMLEWSVERGKRLAETKDPEHVSVSAVAGFNNSFCQYTFTDMPFELLIRLMVFLKFF